MSQFVTSGGQSIGVSGSASVLPMNSFRMDWLDLLAVQGTLKSLLKHHSSKASVLQCSAFFIVQLSHPYMTTGKTIALTRQTFVGKVMSLLFNMLTRLVIAFLPRSKCLLISWLQSPSAVTLEPPKNKFSHCFHCFPIYLPWTNGTWEKTLMLRRIGGRRRRGRHRWDGWMASPTRRTWVWVVSRSWWWTGRPGVLWFMGLQRVGHDWATELNWTELNGTGCHDLSFLNVKF